MPGVKVIRSTLPAKVPDSQGIGLSPALSACRKSYKEFILRRGGLHLPAPSEVRCAAVQRKGARHMVTFSSILFSAVVATFIVRWINGGNDGSGRPAGA